MKRNLIITSILGMLTVIIGAFGAHLLKDKLDVNQLKTFETGVRYQMYHVLVLLFINMYHGFSEKSKNQISLLFILGILLFSGSLYLLSMNALPSKIIGPLTPIGGIFLILGWMSIIYHIIKKDLKY